MILKLHPLGCVWQDFFINRISSSFMTSEMIIKSFRYQKHRYCKYKAILGVWFPIQALHAAYIGEDSSVLST